MDDTQGGFGEVSEREVPENEQVENESEDSTSESEQTDNQESTEETTTQPKEEVSQEPKLTEKGTKLDPNPESAVHQQLANERRTRTQMEQVLGNPDLMAKFMEQQYGIKVPTKGTLTETAASTRKWEVKDFENIEDVADKFNQLQEGFTKEISQRDQKIAELSKQVGGVLDTSRMERIASTTEAGINSLKAQPELDPKSPEFIPGLEARIAQRYQQLDFDNQTGTFRGQFSVKEIGDDFIAIAREARKSGIQKGQTIVKDKTSGKIRTTPGNQESVNRDELSPGDSIALGISKLFPRG